MSGHRWRRRLLTAVVAAGAVLALTAVLDFDPEPLRLTLLVVLVVLALGLGNDVVLRAGTEWYPAPRPVAVLPGRDQATQAHLRLLESHQHSRHPDAMVRDRLAVLADQVLAARHGVHTHSERGRALLGPELVEVLTGPVVRLNPRRIDHLVRQIEEL